MPLLRRDSDPTPILERRFSSRMLGLLFTKGGKPKQIGFTGNGGPASEGSHLPLSNLESYPEEMGGRDDGGADTEDEKSIKSVRSIKNFRNLITGDGGLIKAKKAKRAGKKADEVSLAESNSTLVEQQVPEEVKRDSDSVHSFMAFPPRSSSSNALEQYQIEQAQLAKSTTSLQSTLGEFTSIAKDWSWGSEDESQGEGRSRMRRRSKTAGGWLEGAQRSLPDLSLSLPDLSLDLSLPDTTLASLTPTPTPTPPARTSSMRTDTAEISEPPAGTTTTVAADASPAEAAPVTNTDADSLRVGSPPRSSRDSTLSRRVSKRASAAPSFVPGADEISTPAPLPVPHKQVVTIAGIAIETEDPSHLFWVPAHLHPELHPTDFNDWLAKHEGLGKDLGPNPAEILGGVPGGTGKPLRRTKSFVERHVVITPENLEEFVSLKKEAVIGRSRSMSAPKPSNHIAGSVSPASVAGKGLPPLRRSRGVKTKKTSTNRGKYGDGTEANKERAGDEEEAGMEGGDEGEEKKEKKARRDTGKREALAPRSKRGKKKGVPMEMGLPLKSEEQEEQSGEGDKATLEQSEAAAVPLRDAAAHAGPGELPPPAALPEPLPSELQPVSEESDASAGSDVEEFRPPTPTQSQIDAALATAVSVTEQNNKKLLDDAANRNKTKPASTRTSAESTRSNKDKDGKEPKDKESKKWNWFSGLLTSKPKKSSSSSAASSSHDASSSRPPSPSRTPSPIPSDPDNDPTSYPPEPPPEMYILNGLPRYPLHIEKSIYRSSHGKLAQHRRPLAEQDRGSGGRRGEGGGETRVVLVREVVHRDLAAQAALPAAAEQAAVAAEAEAP
ncbi:hypothetical protein HK104_004002, partial [Borealophlyctis nickersoniae]